MRTRIKRHARRPFSTGGNYINFQTGDEDEERISETYGASATGARARETWRATARARSSTGRSGRASLRRHRFQNGTGRVCAVAKTRDASPVTDPRTWCERVHVSAGF